MNIRMKRYIGENASYSIFSNRYEPNYYYCTEPTCSTCETGVTGSTGTSGSNVIIPFSSGTPISVTSLVGGLVGLPSFIGFGSNAQGISTFGTTINLACTALGVDLNYTFTMPRNGVLTSLRAFFSVTDAVGLDVGNYQIYAQLFRSQSPTSNLFDALATTDIALAPSFPGSVISLGDVATGSATLNIPVAEGDRLLLVFRVEPPALSAAAEILGYASAGLSIS